MDPAKHQTMAPPPARRRRRYANLPAAAAAGAVAVYRSRDYLKRLREDQSGDVAKRIKEGLTESEKNTFMARGKFGRRRRTVKRKRGRIFRPRRALTAHPKTMVRELTTTTYAAVDPGAGTCVVQQFLLNCANDPTGTNNTVQPRYHDQYAALYNYNCVVGWKIFVEVVTVGDDTAGTVIGFTPTTTTTDQGSWQAYKELPGTRSVVLTKDVDKSSFGAKGSVKRWLMPRGGRILTERDLCALTGSNPNQILYGHLWAQSVDGIANPAAVNCVITLKQVVVYFNPVVPGRS